MNFKWPLLTFLGLTVFSFTLLAILGVTNHAPLSPEQTTLNACKTLIYNGEGKTSLLFFADERTTKKYTDYFFSLKPFSDNKGSFNVYYIDDYTPTCTKYKGIALLCYNQEIIEKASSCPSINAIIAFASDSESIRSSAYLGVASLNTNHPYSVFAHEFGHLFGNFAEEYLSGTLPAGQPNCKSRAEEFSVSDGTFKECSNPEYYRSIETGFMRSLQATKYGTYNEKTLQEQINKPHQSVTTGFAASEPQDCSKQSYYIVDAKYSVEKVIPLDVFLTPGCPLNEETGAFSYRDASGTKRALFEPILFTDAPKGNEIDGQDYIDPALPVYIPLSAATQTNAIFYNKQNQELGQTSLVSSGARLCSI